MDLKLVAGWPVSQLPGWGFKIICVDPGDPRETKRAKIFPADLADRRRSLSRLSSKLANLLSSHLFESLYNLKHSRTYERILQRELCDLNHLLTIGVWVFAAGFRSVFVDYAIIFRIEEWTW